MTDSILPRIMTVEDIAGYLRVSNEVVISELEQGHIAGFKVGTEWRCTEASLLDYVSGQHLSCFETQLDSSKSRWTVADFVETGPFEYKWPGGIEAFETGYETNRTFEERTHTFKIGFTKREAAGQDDRPRVVIWMDNWPLVEFAGGNNYKSDKLLVSVIKVKGGKQLRPAAKIPEEYKEFRVVRYDSIVKGPYASGNMAVVVKNNDFESMLKHAIIRATWKEFI